MANIEAGDGPQPGDWVYNPDGSRALVTAVGTAITIVANPYSWRYMRAERGFWRALVAWPFTRLKARRATPFVLYEGDWLKVERQ